MKFTNNSFRQVLLGILFVCLLILATPAVAAPALSVFTVASGDVAGLIVAINMANSNGVADTINLSAGVYNLTAVDNSSLNGSNGFPVGPNGLPIITSEITIIGADAASTIIQRDSTAPNFRIFGVDSTGSLTLTDLTIRNGNIGTGNGGSIYNSAGILTVNNSIFTDNFGTGAGIYNDAGTLSVDNSIFAGNSSSMWGGGIYNAQHGNLTVTDSSFSDNVGAGIHSTTRTTLTVSNSTFSDHSSVEGGGLYNEGLTLIVNSTFTGNSASQEGGGIYFECGSFVFGCEMAVINSTFHGNSAGERGGGIYFDDGSPFTVINSTFTGNTSDSVGGGIYNNGSARIVNSSFSGNSAADAGGSIYNIGGWSNFFSNSTFGGNSAGVGGGIFNDAGVLTVNNSILWGNSDGSGTGQVAQIAEGIVFNSMVIVHHSLIQDDDPTDAFIPFGGAANGNIDDNPLFVRDPDDGGDGWSIGDNDDFGDLRLQPNSPAIDTGNNSLVPADTGDLDGDADTAEPTPLDLDGNPRFVNDIVDMGAYEAQNQPPTADAGGPYTVDEGGSVSLDGSGSTDPDDSTLAYEWDLDYDGITFDVDITGSTPLFDATSLDGPGSRTIALRVTDNAGALDIDTASVTITNVAPTATFANTSGTVIEGEAATLAFSNQFDPGAADTAAGFTYSYDCTNDGVFEASGVAASFDCPYPDSGNFTARARIEDKDGDHTDYTVGVTVLTPQEAIESIIDDVQALVDAGVLNPGSFQSQQIDTVMKFELQKIDQAFSGRPIFSKTSAKYFRDYGKALVLNQGQGNALISKLENAINKLDQGNTDAAINLLQAFINQVNDLINQGILSSAEGQPLIDAANEIIAALSG